MVCCAIGSAGLAYAESLEWLYDVEIDVADRTQSTAEEALQKALQVCLMRVSGSISPIEYPAIGNALEEPSSYLRHYRFSTVVDSTGEENDILVAHFDAELVQELTQQARLPVWPSDRPTILMWLSLRGRTHSKMIKSGTHESDLVNHRARERGIEVVLPLMDLADRQHVNPSSIDGRFWLDIRQASRRYRTDIVVAGSIHEGIFDEARLHMNLWFDEFETSTVIEVDDFANALSRSVDYIADFLADRFAISRDSQEILRIQIFEIETIRSYSSLLTYLEQQEFIDRFEVVSYRGGMLELDVFTPSSAIQFSKLITTDSRLELRPSHEVSAQARNPFEFTWDGDK